MIDLLTPFSVSVAVFAVLGLGRLLTVRPVERDQHSRICDERYLE